MAELPTKLYRIDRSVVLELIERSPNFSTNFYRSLAGILSRRLRVANAVLSAKQEPRASVRKEQYRIFVVDDDPEVRVELVNMLENLGFLTESYGSAEGLLESGRAKDAACLLLDSFFEGRKTSRTEPEGK